MGVGGDLEKSPCLSHLLDLGEGNGLNKFLKWLLLLIFFSRIQLI
jgi:hypothetical protein